MKKVIPLILALALLFCLPGVPSASAEAYIDNSDLTPPYRPQEEVELELSGELWSPDWVDELMMAEVRIETCTEEGTFQSAVKMLDHYQEMGINGLWITPVYDRSSRDRFQGNGYGNYGPETLWSVLTGTEDYEEGFAVLRKFVDEAHKRNIRVLFDIVMWGCAIDAPLHNDHPEIFSGNQVWGGWAYNWPTTAFRKWFVDAASQFILKSGADGFRADLEPTITGYGLFRELRDHLYFAHNVKIAVMSEGNSAHIEDYDLDQGSLNLNHFINATEGKYREYFDDKWHDITDDPASIVDIVRSGERVGTEGGGGSYRYYTYNLLCHDDFARTVQGDLITIGWQAIFTPFIPMWYIGEEWNNPRKGMGGTGVVYFDYIDWEAINDPDNREFYETVKQYIRIRRTYPEIFQYFPQDHRESNICGVPVTGIDTKLQSYARYMDDKAVLVVPNNTADTTTVTVNIPYADMGMGQNAKTVYTVTDLMSGKQIAKGSAAALTAFAGKIAPGELGLYLVEGVTPVVTTTTAKPTTTTTVPTTAAPTTTTATIPTTTATAATTAPTTAAPTTAPVEDTQTAPAFDAAPFIIGGVAVLVIAAAIVVILLLQKKKSNR